MVDKILALSEEKRIRLKLTKRILCDTLQIDYTNYIKSTSGAIGATERIKSRIYLFLLASEQDIKQLMSQGGDIEEKAVSILASKMDKARVAG